MKTKIVNVKDVTVDPQMGKCCPPISPRDQALLVLDMKSRGSIDDPGVYSSPEVASMWKRVRESEAVEVLFSSVTRGPLRQVVSMDAIGNNEMGIVLVKDGRRFRVLVQEETK
jgi:hypothetical protein